MKAADVITEMLHSVGVRRIFGVVGDSLNGITEALRKRGDIDWMHVRHEEVGGLRGRRRGALTGELAVCAGAVRPRQSAPDQRPVRLPPLAACRCWRSRRIFRSAEIGRGYFQETHPASAVPRMQPLLRAGLAPRAAAARARDRHPRRDRPSRRRRRRDPRRRRAGVDAGARFRRGLDRGPPAGRACRRRTSSTRWPRCSTRSKRMTLLCGRGCAGAHDELMQLAEALKSPIVHALGGKEHVEYDNPYDVGMTGLIGFSSGYHAMLRLRHAADAGHRFPVPAVLPDQRQDRAGRSASGESRAPHAARPRPRRRRRRRRSRRCCPS